MNFSYVWSKTFHYCSLLKCEYFSNNLKLWIAKARHNENLNKITHRVKSSHLYDLSDIYTFLSHEYSTAAIGKYIVVML